MDTGKLLPFFGEFLGSSAGSVVISGNINIGSIGVFIVYTSCFCGSTTLFMRSLICFKVRRRLSMDNKGIDGFELVALPSLGEFLASSGTFFEWRGVKGFLPLAMKVLFSFALFLS